MNTLTRAVDAILQSCKASIDYNFRQPNNVYLQQIVNQFGEDYVRERGPDSLLEAMAAESHQSITELTAKVLPRKLPDSYILFLEYYGHLFVHGESYDLEIYGEGPMAEPYDHLSFYNNFYEDPLNQLHVGHLAFFREGFQRRYVYFFLDVTGVLQENCIIGKWFHLEDTRRKVADSFDEWLVLLAQTCGTSGYAASEISDWVPEVPPDPSSEIPF
jgi:hypothetical protein